MAYANTDMVEDQNGISSIEYQWQAGKNSQFIDIPNATSGEYALSPTDFNPNDTIRLVLTVHDYFGAAQILKSKDLLIGKDLLGEPFLFLDNNEIQEGATVFVNTDNLMDENGGKIASYEWFI